MDDRTVRERVERVEHALESLERLPPAPRETALEAVAGLVELYGEAWARAVERLEREHPGAAASLAQDELIAHLLMIHGLHPATVESRVRGALDEVSAAVNAEGLRVELVAIEEGVARLGLHSDRGNPPPVAALQKLVVSAVLGAAPELEDVRIEPPPGAARAAPALVQLQDRRGATEHARPGVGA